MSPFSSRVLKRTSSQCMGPFYKAHAMSVLRGLRFLIYSILSPFYFKESKQDCRRLIIFSMTKFN